MSDRALPQDRIVISPGEHRDVVLDTIRAARLRIVLSLFRCNDRAVFRALGDAVNRGVDVQVLVTSRAKGGTKKLQKLWDRLEDTGAVVHAYTNPVVKYHAKYLVVDEGPALVATLNFTRKCFESTLDALVMTWDPAVVAGLCELMAADRDGDPIPRALDARLIVGPEHARQRFADLITGARTSVRVIDPKLSDPAMLALLSQRHADGLHVQIHEDKQVGGLRAHGRIMLIDDATVVIGSLALTTLSLDLRREVALVCTSPSAVRDIRALFQSIAPTLPQKQAARASGVETKD